MGVAIEKLRTFICEPMISDDESEIKGYNDGIDLAITILSKLPSAQRWIPASERLPFSEYWESDAVLATCRSRQWQDDYRWIKRLYYNGGVWCYPTGEVYEDIVTAWMPLTEPFREDEE